MTDAVAVILMASGHSKRFGGDKLKTKINGMPMIEIALRNLSGLFSSVFVVARDREILALADRHGFFAVRNEDTTDDPAETIKLGMAKIPPEADGVMLMVADQPYLKKESIQRLADCFIKQPDRICRLCHDGEPGNPVIFPRKVFDELRTLKQGERGKTVLRRHPEMIADVPVLSAEELRDIDHARDILP